MRVGLNQQKPSIKSPTARTASGAPAGSCHRCPPNHGWRQNGFSVAARSKAYKVKLAGIWLKPFSDLAVNPGFTQVKHLDLWPNPEVRRNASLVQRAPRRLRVFANLVLQDMQILGKPRAAWSVAWKHFSQKGFRRKLGCFFFFVYF